MLPHAFAEQAFAFRGSGASIHDWRELRATQATQDALAWVIGRMYAERYFPAPTKARVDVDRAGAH